MEEKKIVYQIILDCWNLAKDYFFSGTLTDEQWTEVIDKSTEYGKKYNKMGERYRKLYSEIYFALEHFKETEK